VPDTSEVRINPDTNTLMRQGIVNIINLFDMYAWLVFFGQYLRNMMSGFSKPLIRIFLMVNYRIIDYQNNNVWLKK
jgi:hypothetical protein